MRRPASATSTETPVEMLDPRLRLVPTGSASAEQPVSRTTRATASTPGDYDVAAALFTLDRAVSAGDLQELPELIGKLVSVEERARLRLREGAHFKPGVRATDENISAAVAARRLGVSKYWLYRNARQLPFAHRIGRRVVFSAQGLERWNHQRATR